MTTFIGIDPGYSGTIAALFPSDRLSVYDMPVIKVKGEKTKLDVPRLATLLIPFSEISAYVAVENVHSMPKQGVTSSFNFGYQLGAIEGILEALGIPYQKVAPVTWKKHFALIGMSKSGSRAVAEIRFPEHANLFSRAKDDGRAEATLMALWLKDNYK